MKWYLHVHITIAPGNNEKSRMVLSYTSEIPHLVQHKGVGRFVCDSIGIGSRGARGLEPLLKFI